MTVTLSHGGIVTLTHDSARPITRQYCVEMSKVSGGDRAVVGAWPAGRIGDLFRPDGGRPQTAGGESA